MCISRKAKGKKTTYVHRWETVYIYNERPTKYRRNDVNNFWKNHDQTRVRLISTLNLNFCKLWYTLWCAYTRSRIVVLFDHRCPCTNDFNVLRYTCCDIFRIFSTGKVYTRERPERLSVSRKMGREACENWVATRIKSLKAYRRVLVAHEESIVILLLLGLIVDGVLDAHFSWLIPLGRCSLG